MNNKYLGFPFTDVFPSYSIAILKPATFTRTKLISLNSPDITKPTPEKYAIRIPLQWQRMLKHQELTGAPEMGVKGQ